MTNIMPFQFESKEIRAITGEDGSAWFVAKDVCEAFGDSHYRRSVGRLDEDEKGVTHIDTPGGRQPMTIVNESGLYALLFYMQPQKADRGSADSEVVNRRIEQLKAFKRWVTSEVIPSIRKTGSYSLAVATTSPVKSSPSTPILPWVQKEFKAALSIAKLCGLKGNAAILSASQYVSKLTGTYPLDVANLKHLPSESQARELTPTEIGKTLGGLSPRAVNILLVDAGLQFKGEDGHWRPTDKGRPFSVLKDTSKKHLSGTPVQQMKWLETVVPMLETVRTIGEASLEQDSE